jgi:WS/DGAT/MGAT family acyltransferase
MEQLSGLDGMFIHSEMHALPMHISGFSLYENTAGAGPGECLDIHTIRDIFQDNMLGEVPVMRSFLKRVPLNLDQPYWVEDENFDIEFHIRHIALPKPGNWQSLTTLLADLHALPLDRSRPLWEAYVIDGLDNIGEFPKGSTGLFLKVHHSVMDGRTAMDIFASLHSLEPAGQSIKVQMEQQVDTQSEKANSFHKPGYWQLMSRASRNNSKRLLDMSKLIGRALPAYRNIQIDKIRSGLLSITDNPRTRFNDPPSPHRVIDRLKVPLVDIKLIRKLEKGSTVNDVALCIVGGALRKYLYKKVELPESSLVATVPIDIRNRIKCDTRGNAVSIMNVALRTDIDDARRRLHFVHKESKSAKAYVEVLGPALLKDFMQNIYAAVTSWGAKAIVKSGILSVLPPVSHTIVTNVPGSPVPIYLGKSRLFETFAMGPIMPGIGLFHTITSTHNSLSICFSSCRKMIDDPVLYRQCLEDSFLELQLAAGIDLSTKSRAKVVGLGLV